MTNTAPEVTIWTDPRTAALARQVIDRMSHAVRVIGVGGPRSAEVAALARAHQLESADDLRKLLVDRPAAFLLLTAADDIDAADLASAAAHGTIVVTLEPTHSDLPAYAAKPRSGANAANGAAPQVVFLPSFLRSPGWTSADPREALGAIRLVSYGSFGGPADASLFARLFEAWRVVLSLGQLPETIDASLVGPLAEPPENLRAMTGHLALHARMPDGVSAVIEASDRVGVPSRGMRITGEQGSLRATDHAYELYDASGKQLEEKAAPDKPLTYADLVAMHWSRLISRPDLAPADAASVNGDDSQVLACCVATLLSARTRQPESPAKLLSLQR